MATNVTFLFETKQLKPFIELSSVQETWAWKICYSGQRNVATHAKNMPAELSKEKQIWKWTLLSSFKINHEINAIT